MLRDLGFEVQTMSEVLPIRVMPARILSHVYVRLGNPRFDQTPHVSVKWE